MDPKYHKTREQIEAEYAEIRLASRDPRKFDVLYERYYELLFAFTWNRVSDEALCADLVQQVFLKALINLGKFQFRGLPFSAWLFRIAVNELNMHFRKNPAGRVISVEEGQASKLAEECLDADKEEDKKRILAALTLLDPGSLQLIELRFFEELSFAEIGGILGITENNAKVRTYRALETLKSKLGITS